MNNSKFADQAPASASRIPVEPGNDSVKLAPPVQKKANNSTGLPDKLKSGVEDLSGISMDDVKVHYNSSQPAQLNAQAYAQGNHIHIAPGQEKHLPHEAWHVVQQKQGRVKATMQMKGTVHVNDDKGLEHEADVMGAKALSYAGTNDKPLQKIFAYSLPAVQRKVGFEFESTSIGWRMEGKKTTDNSWKQISNTKKPLLKNTAKKNYISADNGHAEFVTEPLSTIDEVDTSVGGLKSWAELLMEKNKYKFTNDENIAASAHTHFDEHRINNIGPFEAKPQATLGVPINKLLEFYKEMLTLSATAIPESRKRKITHEEQNKIDTAKFKKGMGHEGNMINIVPSIQFAEEFVNELIKNHVPPITNEVAAELKGFAALVDKTFRDSQHGEKLSDPKQAFPLLPRVSFSRMYQSLSPDAQAILHNNWSNFEHSYWGAVTKLGKDQPAFPKGAQQVYGGLHKQGPTYSKWLESMYDAAAPTDLMTGFANNNEPDTSKHEGFGALSMDGKMTLIEMRSLFANINKSIPPDQWLNLAHAVADLALKYHTV